MLADRLFSIIGKYATLNNQICTSFIIEQAAGEKNLQVLKPMKKNIHNVLRKSFSLPKPISSFHFPIYTIAWFIKSKNRRPYCSGSTVEMPSALDPYLTVFAAFAACFLTP